MGRIPKIYYKIPFGNEEVKSLRSIIKMLESEFTVDTLMEIIFLYCRTEEEELHEKYISPCLVNNLMNHSGSPNGKVAL